jgi:nucleotide-binding universal stress UspA family protein
MIIMGSYGHGPLLEALRGSTVDEVLRGARVPVLICV